MDQSEVLKFEQAQKQRTWKLSEAILAGIKIRPNQCFGSFFSYEASCAIGAAYEGVGLGPEDIDKPIYFKRIPTASKAAFAFYKEYGIHITVANDVSRWSREKIAYKLQLLGY